MNKLKTVAALAALFLGQSQAVQAADVTVAIGQTDDASMTYRLGTQFDFSESWLQSSVGRVTGYWDAGYTYWESGNGSSGSNSLSFAPVFVYEFAGDSVKPFIEAGIGVAVFSETEVDGNKLGSAFQFEDRLGVGLRFAEQEVGLRAMHYSNASIKEPNEGVESYSLYYRHSF